MRRVGTSRSGLVFELGGGLLVDTAGNNTVTNNGATLTTDHNGRANRGWSFDGVDDSFILPGTLIQSKQKLSISFGVKRNNTTAQRFISYYNSETEYMPFYFEDNIFRIYWDAGGINMTTITIDTNLDYHLFSVVYDGSQSINANRVVIYRDAVSFAITNRGSIPATLPAYEGKLYIAQRGTLYSNINIDYLNINDNVLTGSEIKKLYNYWRSH